MLQNSLSPKAIADEGPTLKGLDQEQEEEQEELTKELLIC